VRQQENRLRREEAAAGGSPFDAIRLEQFLALEHDVLVAAGDPATLSDRLAQAVTVFLGVAGAAVGVVDGGVYRVLATYGVPRDYAARYDGVSIRVAPLESAFAGARPVVVDDDFAGAALRTFLLPFRGHVLAGALHVITAREAVPADDDVRLARALAELAGVALDNARQWERLTAVARLRGDALATMAHDLRTPLNALVGYATLLGEGAFGTLVPEQQTIADTLARQAVELVDLLGATLDVARLESGRLPIRRDEFSLADLLRTMLAGTFAAAARDGVLTCNVPTDLPVLRTDRVKVKEILQNLVDNALKHGEGRAVEIDVALAPGRDTVRLTVRDHGPGIPADVLPHLFEPFRAGPGRGTGFGLYIVRCFTEALGGRVAARSSAGTGSAITVELPVGGPESTPASKPDVDAER